MSFVDELDACSIPVHPLKVRNNPLIPKAFEGNCILIKIISGTSIIKTGFH